MRWQCTCKIICESWKLLSLLQMAALRLFKKKKKVIFNEVAPNPLAKITVYPRMYTHPWIHFKEMEFLFFFWRKTENTFAWNGTKRKEAEVEIREIEIVRELIVRDGPRIRGRWTRDPDKYTHDKQPKIRSRSDILQTTPSVKRTGEASGWSRDSTHSLQLSSAASMILLFPAILPRRWQWIQLFPALVSPTYSMKTTLQPKR